MRDQCGSGGQLSSCRRHDCASTVAQTYQRCGWRGVLRNGEHFARHRPHGHIGASNVGSAAVDQVSAHRRAQMLEDIVSQGLSTRITGSVGLDLAFAAEGVFDGIMNFSPFPWDNAAGALLNSEAGLVVTDLEGRPWTTRSHGIIAGSADIHYRLHRLVREN